MTTTKKYIYLEDCKHGWLYRIFSRNLRFGVFISEVQGFVGIREKFDHLYLFTEYHYDTGAPFGTAWPRDELELCPITDLEESHEQERINPNTGKTEKFLATNKPLFDWLKQKEEGYKDLLND